MQVSVKGTVPEQEEKLTGGNTAELVVRLGSTVRKPVTRATPAVHSLLRHLRAAGCEASPEAFGIDEQGRQILELCRAPFGTAAGRVATWIYAVPARSFVHCMTRQRYMKLPKALSGTDAPSRTVTT